MSSQQTQGNTGPTSPEPAVSDETIPTENVRTEQLSVHKTIVLPSAQAPAEPPMSSQATQEPPQSDAKEK